MPAGILSDICQLMTQVLVLNYHAIDPLQPSGDELPDAVFGLPQQAFEWQLDFLCAHRIPVVSLDDVCQNRVTCPFAVAITFDDACASDHLIAAPALRARGLSAAFFVPTERFQAAPATLDAWKNLSKQGFIIGSHSVTHRYFTHLSEAEQLTELTESKRWLESQLGGAVAYFALPGGKMTRTTANLARKSGYKVVLTTNFALNKPAEHPFLIHRWSLKRHTTSQDFAQVVSNNPKAVRKQVLMSAIKKRVHRVLGDGLADRINYFLYS